MANDQWVPGPPPPPPPPPNGLPPANSWAPSPPCSSGDNPAIIDGIVITGVPAKIVAPYAWGITLNDGANPPNFTIDRYDAGGNLIDNPIDLSGVDGSIAFNDPVYLSQDPIAPMEAATKEYVDSEIAAIGGIPEAPIDASVYGRGAAAWQIVPPEAPNDGAAYVRQGLAWAPLSASLSGYMPLSGGVFTGVVQFPANNSVAIVGAAGTQRAILGGTAGPPTAFRWQMMLGDQTAESGGNAGSDFALNAISDTGAILSTPLAIARSTGVITVGVTPGVTPLALNGAQGSWRSVAGQTNGSARWQMYLGDFGAELGGNLGSNFRLSSYADNGAALASPLIINRQTGQATFSALPSFPGGALNYVLATNGAGVLAWAAPQGGAPPSTIPPLMNGTAAVGTGTNYSREDHVHPTDTSRAAASALPPAATTTPLPDAVGAVGVSTAYARADHVHPVSAYAHDNRIINGDMRIDQRNNGAVTTPAPGSVYVIDRWGLTNNTGAARGNCQRLVSGAGLLALGWPYNFSFQSTSAYTAAAGDNLAFYQAIEADMVSDFAWGSASAQPVTLSFWALASVAGTYSGAIKNQPSPATRSYPFSFALTANTWTKVVVTIPGDTAGTWVLAGNAGGVMLAFDLGSGSNLRGPANAWANGNFHGATGAVSVVAANGGAFNFTGVKLEIGSVATPFTRQSPGKNLADCQRYYVRPNISFQVAGYATAASQNATGVWSAPQTMRATPTIVSSFGGSGNAAGSVTALPDARTVQVLLTSGAAGIFFAQTTITSLDAEL